METKSARWTLRVTPAQDAAARRVIEVTGESLNDYVVRHAVEAANDDLADRRVFAIDDAAWVELQNLLDRPPVVKPQRAKFLNKARHDFEASPLDDRTLMLLLKDITA